MDIFEAHLQWIYGSDESSVKRRLERKELIESMGLSPIDEEESSPKLIVDSTQLAELMARGIAVERVKKHTLSRDSMDTALERFEAVAKKLSALPLPEASYNERCEVHIPGQALSTYNDTLLLEDSCTDSLQDALNSGWRIIACCPQPDSRRPDYILGRFNPDFTANGTRAKRNPKDI